VNAIENVSRGFVVWLRTIAVIVEESSPPLR